MTATAEKSEKKDKKKKSIMKFILRQGVGSHFEPNPHFDKDEPETEDNLRDIEYTPGETVISTRQLDKIFVNKFKRMQGDATGGQSVGGDTFEGDPEDDPDGDRPVTTVEDALVRRADRHLEEEELEGKDDLIKKSKGKKVKVTAKDDDEDEEEPEDDEDEESSDDDEEEEEDEPEDVTDNFKGASDGGLKVLKDGEGKYRVYEEDDLETPMDGAKKGFKKKDEVKAFIKKQVSSK